jgi:TRAP-type C4-dicarboxylate transport system substrate-binding protein
MHRSLPIKISGLVAGAVMATVMSHAAMAEEWKFAIEEIEGSVQDAYAQEFKRLIEEKTGGDVTVTIYPYGALGTSAISARWYPRSRCSRCPISCRRTTRSTRRS